MALFLTGDPGVGKTTIIRAVGRKLEHFRPVGFYTEEVRAGRERRGFRLVTFGGETATIAHIDFPPPRVSKYGVDVALIDRFAASLQAASQESSAASVIDDEVPKQRTSEASEPARSGAGRWGPRERAREGVRRDEVPRIYLVDEIGKMECLSTTFVRTMKQLVESDLLLVATVGARGGGFIDEVKRSRSAEVWTVTAATRDSLPDRVVAWIETHVIHS